MRHQKPRGLAVATNTKTRLGRSVVSWMRTNHPDSGTSIVESIPDREPLTIAWEVINNKHRRGSVNGYVICDLIRHEDKWLLRDGGGRTKVGTVSEGERVAQHRFDKRQEGYSDD